MKRLLIQNVVLDMLYTSSVNQIFPLVAVRPPSAQQGI